MRSEASSSERIGRYIYMKDALNTQQALAATSEGKHLRVPAPAIAPKARLKRIFIQIPTEPTSRNKRRKHST